jgi:hypothetical protein
LIISKLLEMSNIVKDLVHRHYWENNDNCAVTSLSILGDYFGVEINQQTLSALTGMNGAGKKGAQCGLIEGTLSFIGIVGKKMNYSNFEIESLCHRFADQVEVKKGSLLCKQLRPQGFSVDNPPHLCEKITVDLICFSIQFIESYLMKKTTVKHQPNYLHIFYYDVL